MTKEQLFRKLIQKAINNGWQVGAIVTEDLRASNIKVEGNLPQVFHQWEWIPFDHAFAKALWGEHKRSLKSDYCVQCGHTTFEIQSGKKKLPCWKYCLQQLAISEDRFKYLEQFV